MSSCTIAGVLYGIHSFTHSLIHSFLHPHALDPDLYWHARSRFQAWTDGDLQRFHFGHIERSLSTRPKIIRQKRRIGPRQENDVDGLQVADVEGVIFGG